MQSESKSVAFYQEQIARAHRLAKSATDDDVRMNLLAFAREYEALIAKVASQQDTGLSPETQT